jgi:hypothetical protein
MNSCQLVIPRAAGAGSFSLWRPSRATIDVHGRWRPASEEEELLGRPDSSGLVESTVLLLVEVLGRPAFPTIQRIRLAVIGLAPVALLAGLIDAQLARTSVGDLFMELRSGPADLRTPAPRPCTPSFP